MNLYCRIVASILNVGIFLLHNLIKQWRVSSGKNQRTNIVNTKHEEDTGVGKNLALLDPCGYICGSQE